MRSNTYRRRRRREYSTNDNCYCNLLFASYLSNPCVIIDQDEVLFDFTCKEKTIRIMIIPGLIVFFYKCSSFVCMQVHKVRNLFFNLPSFNSSLLCVFYFASCLFFFFCSQRTINLRGSMRELLLEQQLGTLNRFRFGTIRRCHHQMTDRQTDDREKKR
jgi:hypothetical protein